MTYVLKTRAITGVLVPLNGEHIEYDDLTKARRYAQIWSAAHGETVSIVDFLFGDVVEEVLYMNTTAYPDNRP